MKLFSIADNTIALSTFLNINVSKNNIEHRESRILSSCLRTCSMLKIDSLKSGTFCDGIKFFTISHEFPSKLCVYVFRINVRKQCSKNTRGVKFKSRFKKCSIENRYENLS